VSLYIDANTQVKKANTHELNLNVIRNVKEKKISYWLGWFFFWNGKNIKLTPILLHNNHSTNLISELYIQWYKLLQQITRTQHDQYSRTP